MTNDKSTKIESTEITSKSEAIQPSIKTKTFYVLVLNTDCIREENLFSKLLSYTLIYLHETSDNASLELNGKVIPSAVLECEIDAEKLGPPGIIELDSGKISIMTLKEISEKSILSAKLKSTIFYGFSKNITAEEKELFYTIKEKLSDLLTKCNAKHFIDTSQPGFYSHREDKEIGQACTRLRNLNIAINKHFKAEKRDNEEIKKTCSKEINEIEKLIKNSEQKNNKELQKSLDNFTEVCQVKDSSCSLM